MTAAPTPTRSTATAYLRRRCDLQPRDRLLLRPGLHAEVWQNFENYTNHGTGSETVIGTNGVNVITTGSGANTLIGLGGDDQLNGGGGIDMMSAATAATPTSPTCSTISCSRPMPLADRRQRPRQLLRHRHLHPQRQRRASDAHPRHRRRQRHRQRAPQTPSSAMTARTSSTAAPTAPDILQGELGNDTYVLGAGSDTVNESGGSAGGIDTVTSTITRAPSAGGLLSVEHLIMLGAGTGDRQRPQATPSMARSSPASTR